jgi:hypothetical protein
MPGCRFLQVLYQLVELEFPEALVARDPIDGIAHGRCHQRSAMRASLEADAGETCAFEHTDVLGHCRQAHVEAGCQLADRLVARRQAREDLASGRVGQGAKRAIERLLINHLVYYVAAPQTCQGL